jgi:hypothetical protein
MRDRVLQDAARAMAGVDTARIVPLARDAAVCLAAMAVLIFVLPHARIIGPAEAPLPSPQVAGAPASGDLVVDVVPPPYTGRPAVQVRNPAGLEALAGSVAAMRVVGVSAPSVRLNGTPIAVENGVARVTLRDSGAISIDAADVHRLLPLTVAPDAAPDVRVTAPGKDLRVADARASIPIHAAASDDIALRDLSVRYTVVSGGGEQYSFREGMLAATVSRENLRVWKADATLSLAALKLEPGDALIYRAVASDARPGSAGEASSDTYFVEIAGPGDTALEGVDMPPDRERYALSEAMVVLKIQRLIARESGLPRAELEETVATIAAEQRAVRANFVFLLGGEVEDEVVEAEASHEIQEGRLANQARREIVAATVLMGKVEQALAAVATRRALPLAQEAVRTLQRAFGHSRYLLRALPARIRVDPARRLSGDVASARDWTRELVPPAAEADVERARRALAEAAAIARDPGAADAGARLFRLAGEILAVAPGAADVQASARRVLDARDLLARGDAVKARAALQDAIGPLLPRSQRGRVDATPIARDAARLAGAAATGGRGSR